MIPHREIARRRPAPPPIHELLRLPELQPLPRQLDDQRPPLPRLHSRRRRERLLEHPPHRRPHLVELGRRPSDPHAPPPPPQVAHRRAPAAPAKGDGLATGAHTRRITPNPMRARHLHLGDRPTTEAGVASATTDKDRRQGLRRRSADDRWWLRIRRRLRMLSVNGIGTDSDVRTDPRRRSRCDSENLRRERWDRFADSLCPILSPSPRDRVPLGHVERERAVPTPAGL